MESNSEAPVQQTGTGVPKIPLALSALVGLLVGVAMLVLFGGPDYVQTKKENEDLKQQLTTANNRLEESKNEVTYYPNGQIESKTSVIFKKTSQTSSSSTDLSESSYDKTVRRGTVGIGLLWGDSTIPKAGTVDASILGPIGFEGYLRVLDKFEVLAGPKLYL